MSRSPAHILVYGQDSALLETRKLVLQHAGFDVTVALEMQTAEEKLAAQPFDLFILCHSLSLRNCEEALALTHTLRSGMKNLILSTALSGCSGGAGDVTLSAFANPRTLIETVNKLSAKTEADS